MNNARQREVKSGQWTDAVLIIGTTDKERKRKHNTPCKRMKYKVEISMPGNIHHLVPVGSIHIKLIEMRRVSGKGDHDFVATITHIVYFNEMIR
jgi:hypothetical protein